MLHKVWILHILQLYIHNFAKSKYHAAMGWFEYSWLFLYCPPHIFIYIFIPTKFTQSTLYTSMCFFPSIQAFCTVGCIEHCSLCGFGFLVVPEENRPMDSSQVWSGWNKPAGCSKRRVITGKNAQRLAQTSTINTVYLSFFYFLWRSLPHPISSRNPQMIDLNLNMLYRHGMRKINKHRTSQHNISLLIIHNTSHTTMLSFSISVCKACRLEEIGVIQEKKKDAEGIHWDHMLWCLHEGPETCSRCIVRITLFIIYFIFKSIVI